MDTTEDFSICFHTVPDNTAIAVRANRRQRVDCAFETVENVALSAHDHFEGLVIIIFANFACRHTQFVRVRRGAWRCLFTVTHEIQWPGCGDHDQRTGVIITAAFRREGTE